MSKDDFRTAAHTIVLSDIHLAEAQPRHRNPLWKRYKRPKHFIDRAFKRLLEHLAGSVGEQIELILNGDIFDFDSTMAIPEDPPFPVTWLERKRGLGTTEPKSRYKMRVILDAHPVWVEAIRAFVQAGHHVVFVIGNHDLELHWPAVQSELFARLQLEPEERARVRICEWFYVSNGDTLIEHGNQYDAYCACANPVNPLIRRGSRILVRLPFGNLAGKLMMNGMGLFNPHVEDSFIKSSFWEYVRYFYTYVIRTQPLLPWTWFWSATWTLGTALDEALQPAVRDPLTFESRVDEIAQRSNSTKRVVRSLAQLHSHPAIFNPLKVMRELWLDRALLVLLALVLSVELVLFVNLFVSVSLWAMLVPLTALMPGVIAYARSVESDVEAVQRAAIGRLDLSSQIADVPRVVHGHTHREMHRWVKGVELVNTGTWSPAFLDVECTQPYGRKCFAWLRPTDRGTERSAALYEWMDPGLRLVPSLSDEATEVLPRPGTKRARAIKIEKRTGRGSRELPRRSAEHLIRRRSQWLRRFLSLSR